MRGEAIVFTGRERAELEPFTIDPADLKRGEAIVRGEYSIISAGTEGSFYTNLMAETPAVYRGGQATPPASIYPARTGYGHLGTVLAVGPETSAVQPGDRILTFSRHGSLVRANVARFALPVPAAADGRQAVFTRMAGVAITALRASSFAAGETVAVIGLGLVGNLAAQLFQLAGAEVLALDPAAHRVELARRCGVRRAEPLSGDAAIAAVREWTGGIGARVVVEAVGRSDLLAQGVEMAARHGEVISLGSPRASYTADLTPMLARLHLQAIRLIGALEWTFPIPDTERAQHSILNNYRIILRWIMEGRLVVDPLRTHVLPPERCQEAYAGLTHHKDDYLGVVFDWTKEDVSV
jgi:2-desacetyl-2-hydroxyethyl bacteriochlorophyllide A dehydrogenase